MTISKINYKGIARAGSHQQVDDGYLDEAINTRHRDGKLTTRGKVTKLYALPATPFDIIRYHDQDEISNYIGYVKSTGQLHRITFGVSSSTSSVIYSLAAGTEANIAFIKRFMIITTDTETLTFLFFEGSYIKIDMPDVPDLVVRAIDMEHYITEKASTANGLLGYYFKKINEVSEKYGKLSGGIMYRIVFRMFDGSYVLHTLPRFLSLGMEIKISGDGDDEFWMALSASNIEISVFKEHFETINTDIFTDVMVFACKNESIYEVSENTIDEDLLDDANTGIDPIYGFIHRSLSLYSSVMNEDFKDMPDSKSWYKIYEKKIKDIQDITEIFVSEKADTKGFYQDYATRETLPVDQFSHHKISGEVAYTYNDRILLGKISTEFGKYTAYLQPLDLDGTNRVQKWRGLITNAVIILGLSDYNILTLENVSQTIGTIAFEFTISAQGKKIIITNQADNQSFYSDAEKYYFALPEIIGYPDTRATQMRVLYYDSTNTRWIEVSKFNLKASKNDNYAYYCENITINVEPADTAYTTNPQTARRYIVAELLLSEMGDKVTTLSAQEDLIDSNRIQASELQNPLFFPAKNSYQVGTGKILALAANTEPLSTGQFGEYPLAVFTSKGIWTMLQGSGEVLFSNILPLNGEVSINVDQITPLSVGVVYSTQRGLYLISGREVKNLSEVLVGPVNVEFQANSHYQFYINHASLVQLSSKLSTVDAKTYISGAKIGYDKQNNELLVTNYSYPYSYVYSFESGYWYKTSDSFRLLINAYPTLLGVNTTGIHSISDENLTGSVQVLITTRPCKLEMESTYKLIRQAIQRCELKTPENIFAGFYIFASNDLQKWQLFSINNKRTGDITDIQVLRGYTKAKYYIFVFAAELDAGSAINNVDILFDPVLSNKLR